MVLLCDIKGNKRKVNITQEKEEQKYDTLPGVYVTVSEKHTQEALTYGNSKRKGRNFSRTFTARS